MKKISTLSYFFLSSFSNPKSDRILYRAIKKSKVSSILEIGVGDGHRAETMIRVAKKFSGSGAVRYTGIDRFEADPNSTSTLKGCHQQLNQLDAKIQLVPGEMYPALHRIANSHTRTDLLIISAGYEPSSLDSSWFYIPRMLHATSLVFLQDAKDPEASFERLTRLEIERKVAEQPSQRARAA